MKNVFDIEVEVCVRKYEVDKERLIQCIQEHKKPAQEIADILGKPRTMVEHWFRKDRYFAIPDADIWLQLKELIGIDADALIRKIQEGHKFGSLTITELISECPTADVVEMVHGEWLNTTHGLKCSVCDTLQTYASRYFNYCPNCGARMDEKGKEN